MVEAGELLVSFRSRSGQQFAAEVSEEGKIARADGAVCDTPSHA
jgi:hypothetical protein